jgi:hypothetical protein
MEGILAHASASWYAPSHGSWEARVSEPSHANQTAPRAERSGVRQNYVEQRLALWEIIKKCLLIFKGACVRSSSWNLEGHRAHNLLKRS